MRAGADSRMRVITSYSIHYTKLYEAFADRIEELVEQVIEQPQADVLTEVLEVKRSALACFEIV